MLQEISKRKRQNKINIIHIANKFKLINIGENTPIFLKYSLTLQAIDFISGSKNVLLTSAHIQLVRRDMLYLRKLF